MVYEYSTGRPGVGLAVGGRGVLHAMAGFGNVSVNAFTLLSLAGSSETHLVKGSFREMDIISLLTPPTKISIRTTKDSILQPFMDSYGTS